MIRVTIEIWPGGNEARALEVACMSIANISDLAAVSDYAVWASSKAHPPSGKPAFEARGVIEGHRRRDSIWLLVARATGWVAAAIEK